MTRRSHFIMNGDLVIHRVLPTNMEVLMLVLSRNKYSDDIFHVLDNELRVRVLRSTEIEWVDEKAT